MNSTQQKIILNWIFFHHISPSFCRLRFTTPPPRAACCWIPPADESPSSSPWAQGTLWKPGTASFPPCGRSLGKGRMPRGRGCSWIWMSFFGRCFHDLWELGEDFSWNAVKCHLTAILGIEDLKDMGICWNDGYLWGGTVETTNFVMLSSRVCFPWVICACLPVRAEI